MGSKYRRCGRLFNVKRRLILDVVCYNASTCIGVILFVNIFTFSILHFKIDFNGFNTLTHVNKLHC